MVTKNKQVEAVMSTGQSISMRNYFNSAFKSFSHEDNTRSIPSIDGLKPSQRKAIYGTMKGRGETPPFLSVERLSAGVAERTDYHHGVGSMISTISGMGAVKYPGSNNMNLFVPEGQFGSRLTKEPGAGRYIETTMSHYFRQMFSKDDDVILEHNVVDGDNIEPKVYIPLLPFVLINGASGTGTGHACEIKSYNPNEIRDVILNILNDKITKPGTLIPWFRGFHGTVIRNPETGQVLTEGKLEIINSTTIRITELPVGVFLDPYKEHLNKLEDDGLVKQYTDSSSEESFDFLLTVPRSTTELSKEELFKKFKLVGRDTENFTVWNADNVLEKYSSAEELIEAFVPWRLEKYELRRTVTIAEITENVRFQSEVIRFIKFYQSHVNIFRDTNKSELIKVLLENKFVDYDKLLNMPIWNLTKDKIADLENKLVEMLKKLKALHDDSAIEMYKRELNAFNYKE